MAVIGTSFGQPQVLQHMRPAASRGGHRDRTVTAVAREADEEERKAIWSRAVKIYAGYDAYASRIKGRDIHIMILSA